jgi:hypothetical protein
MLGNKTALGRHGFAGIGRRRPLYIARRSHKSAGPKRCRPLVGPPQQGTGWACDAPHQEVLQDLEVVFPITRLRVLL